MATYEYEIGAASGSTVNVETLGLNPPKSEYTDYPRKVSLQSLQERAIGYPEATWTWGFIENADRTILRGYCSGKSATVYIRTKDTAGVYHDYQTIMYWPDKESREPNDLKLNFTVRFKIIAEVV